jgi:CBS-domain-containing membrane protein
MIVRVMTEGQYELNGSVVEALRHEDEALLAAVVAADADGFRRHLDRVLAMVREGKRLDVATLAPSDLVVPPPDMSVTEARRLLDEHQIY